MTGYRETQAVVLRLRDQGESDRRLRLLTPQGALSARAPGVRKAQSRLAGTLQPAAFVQLTLYEQGGRLATVTGAAPIEGFRRLREDLPRLAAAQVLLEIADHTGGEEDMVRPFVALVEALRHLDEGEDPGADWLIGELRLLEAYGWGIDLERCQVCGGALAAPLRYPVQYGGFTCGRCGGLGGVHAGPAALAALRAAARGARPTEGTGEARALLHLTWQAHLEAPLRSVGFAESMLESP